MTEDANCHDIDQQGWESVLDTLYAAAGDEEALSAALGRLRPAFGAQRVSLLTHPEPARPGALQVAACDVPAAMLLEYQTHYVADDVWMAAAARHQLVFEGAVVRGSALVSEEELRRSRFWRDYLVRYDQSDVLAGVLEAPGADGGSSTSVTFMRSLAAGPFDAVAEATLVRLLPDLQRVLKLHRRLAPQIALGQSLGRLYEQMALPMGFVDAQGRLLEANPAARAVLAEGLLLRTDAIGRLHARGLKGWQDLGGMLAGLEQQPDGQLLLAGDGSRGPAALMALRRAVAWQGLGDVRAPALAVLALRTLDLQLDGDLIGSRFDLTPRELVVAQGLDQGMTAQVLAEPLGVGLATVRTYIATLMQKTHSSRQSELLQRLRGR